MKLQLCCVLPHLHHLCLACPVLIFSTVNNHGPICSLYKICSVQDFLRHIPPTGDLRYMKNEIDFITKYCFVHNYKQNK